MGQHWQKRAFAVAACLLCLGSGLPAHGQFPPPYNLYMPGWKAQPRPPLPDSSSLPDYDWTGLDLSAQFTYFSAMPYGYTQKWYAGRPASYLPVYGFGGSSGVATALLELSNTSTFKWKWQAPYMPNTNTPDATNFPMPPLYVLGRVDPEVRADPETVGVYTGLSASGNVADGWGGSAAFNGIPGSAYLTPRPKRKVCLATAGQDIATALMSPSAQVQGMGTAAGAKGTLAMTALGLNIFPIVLASPSPFGLPTLGDGTNQFVYDSQTPGQLLMPGAIQLMGAYQQDTDWLLQQNAVEWEVRPAISTMVPYNKTAFNDQITPRTVVGYVTYGNMFVYQGLPSANSSFGDRTMYLKVQGADAQTARFQVFFNATATNHPGVGSGTVPNWYYYYNQVYPAPGNYGPGSSRNTTDSSGQRIIIIGDTAHGLRTHRVFNRITLANGTRHIHYAATLDVGGIHRYIIACGHEKGHYDHYTRGIEFTQPDMDGDTINDAWEARNNLDPTHSDTSRAYLNDPPDSINYGKGDRECLADIAALGTLRPHKELWRQDWSNDGLQWSRWGPRNPSVTQYWGPVVTPYHPWYYIQRASNGNPAAVLTDPPWDAVLTSLTQLGNGGH